MIAINHLTALIYTVYIHTHINVCRRVKDHTRAEGWWLLDLMMDGFHTVEKAAHRLRKTSNCKCFAFLLLGWNKLSSPHDCWTNSSIKEKRESPKVCAVQLYTTTVDHKRNHTQRHKHTRTERVCACWHRHNSTKQQISWHTARKIKAEKKEANKTA